MKPRLVKSLNRYFDNSLYRYLDDSLYRYLDNSKSRNNDITIYRDDDSPQKTLPLLTLSHLTTGYRHAHAPRIVSRDLCASLPEATVTALVGVNGSGKSTLLRTIAALQPALAGEITWKGRNLATFDRETLAKTIAVVLTTRPQGDGLTARQVVELGRLPYTGFTGHLTQRDRHIATEAMRLTAVTDFAARPIASLSDGELQRVMIAKALAQQTPVILLDEPTAYLDFPSKVATLRLLCRLARDMGKTILLSTHDLELAFRCVSRLWLLTPDGLTEGSPTALAQDGTIAQLFAADGLTFDAATLRFTFRGA